MIRFHSPIYFLLLCAVPVVYFLFFKRKKSALRFSSIQQLKQATGNRSRSAHWMVIILRTIALILLITALARPQEVESEREFETKGIDIVIALDISGSMLAEDFKPIDRKSTRLNS